MGKRLTDAGKWRNLFRRISTDARDLWLFINDECDAAGVWQCDREQAEFFIRRKLEWDKTLAELGEFVTILDDGRWVINDFLCFQYRKLSERCKPHLSVIELIHAHGFSFDPNAPVSRLSPTPPKREPEQSHVGAVADRGGLPSPDVGPSIEPPGEPSCILPTLAEFKQLAQGIGLPDADVEECFHHYAAVDFMRGSTRITNFRSLLAGWKSKATRFSQTPRFQTQAPTKREGWKIRADLDSVKEQLTKLRNGLERTYRLDIVGDGRWNENLLAQAGKGNEKAKTDLADLQRLRDRRRALEEELKHA